MVAGSIALDTLEGQFGTVHEELGGSALFFALAASLIVPVKVVAPVGRESEAQVRQLIHGRPIDASFVQVLDAPTYRWRALQATGRNIDLGSRDRIYDLWEPQVPRDFRGWAFVGSVRPDRQVQLLIGFERAEMIAADAMLSYVRTQPPEAREVLRRSRWYFCNAEEYEALGGGDPESFRRAWELEGLVLKAGAKGVTAYTERGHEHVPALAARPVVDTTGAGDAIAAGMLAHWMMAGRDPDALRESLMWGVACASLTIADVGLRGLAAATREDLEKRVMEVKKSTRR